MPSAVVLSVLIHVALFLLAGMLVVFTVVKKEEKKFAPPKAVERPKMKLKKPKVTVKKTSQPKPTQRIVTKMNRASMPDIQLPEMSGMGDGLGDMVGGFDMMPDFETVSVFGSGQSIGNDFEGYLYDLKRDRANRNIPMDGDTFRQKLRDFVIRGWDPSEIARYYRSPKKLYTTQFILAPLPSPMAPDIFGEPEMQCHYFMVHYKGKLVSKEPITFRFWGNGNAFLMVRVNGENVLTACWDIHDGYFDWWQSTSPDTRRYFLGDQKAAVGDWITLEAGVALDMEVMFGEWKGGRMAAILAVEVQGVDYEKTTQGGPLLPAFKTDELPRELLDEIRKYLPAGELSLTNGPIFRDYDLAARTIGHGTDGTEPELTPEAVPQEGSSDNEMRTWTLMDGRTFEAEFVSLASGRAVIKNDKGKLRKIPMKNLSVGDRKFIQLEMPPEFDISFSKQSEQRAYPETRSGKHPMTTTYHTDFSAKIRQTSTKNYDHELQAEVFVVGAEFGGDQYMLLDRFKSTFMLTAENHKSIRVKGKTVDITDYQVGKDSFGWQHRGRKYSSYLVVITDSRGEIIGHKTPKKWLFENFENLKKLPVDSYFDNTCTRVDPSRPKPFGY